MNERTRISDLRYPTYWLTDMVRVAPGISQNYVDANGNAGTYSSMFDNVHPSWKVRKGIDTILGPLQLVRSSREFSPGNFAVGPFSYDTILGGPGSARTIHGDIAASVESVAGTVESVVSKFSSNMEDITLVEAMSKVDEAVLLSGEILHDLDQTVSMLRRPLRGATELLTKMVKHRKLHAGKTAESFARATAGSWLEYRYGWKPLILDIKGVYAAATTKVSSIKPRRIVARSTRSATFSGRKEFVDVPLAAGSSLQVTGAVQMEESLKVSAGVIYYVNSSSSGENLARITGSRLSDLPSTIWEVIPYSFVVDWFVNVGPWIQAVTPKPSVKIAGTWCTVVSKREDKISSGSLRDTMFPSSSPGEIGSSVRKMDIVTRTINPVMTSTPVWRHDNLSTLHSIDATALALGRVISGLKSFAH